jgi:16S rRNA (cytosine1402-N4)-methyltransferase
MHQPVLLKEVMEFLQVRPGGTYVDGTLGLGGHAEAIAKALQGHGRLLGLDVDPSYIQEAERRLQPFGNLTLTRLVNFRGLQRVLHELNWENVDGLIFDLGFSSPQMEDPSRGLSFQLDGPLDMRLDPNLSKTALDCLREVDEKDLALLLKEYGENRFARKLARAIKNDVLQGLIHTTKDLAQLCERVVYSRGKTHPATRVFLALRILVNDENNALKELLSSAPSFLSVGGRILIISFQSTEDRIVKWKFRELENEGLNGKKFKVITKKPIVPSEDEALSNPRSRSSKLRVLERVA